MVLASRSKGGTRTRLSRPLSDANRYAQADGTCLCEAPAKWLSVRREEIILGNGSTDLIRLVASTVLAPGTSAVTSAGSFPPYSISVRAMGAALIAVPLWNLTFDLKAIADAVEPETKLIFLANPKTPTGTMFEADAFA
jgi:histidinol-phosphate aminotransferase